MAMARRCELRLQTPPPSMLTRSSFPPEIGMTRFRDGLAFVVALVLRDPSFSIRHRNFSDSVTAGLVAVAEHSGNARSDVEQEAVEAMRKRIGNLDFDRASHCAYHLSVHVMSCINFRRHTLTWRARLSQVQYRADSRRMESRNCRMERRRGSHPHAASVSLHSSTEQRNRGNEKQERVGCTGSLWLGELM